MGDVPEHRAQEVRVDAGDVDAYPVQVIRLDADQRSSSFLVGAAQRPAPGDDDEPLAFRALPDEIPEAGEESGVNLTWGDERASQGEDPELLLPRDAHPASPTSATPAMMAMIPHTFHVLTSSPR